MTKEEIKAHIVKLGWEPREWGSNGPQKYMASRGMLATPFRATWDKVLLDCAFRRTALDAAKEGA